MRNSDRRNQPQNERDVQERRHVEKYRKDGEFVKGASDDSDRITTEIQSVLENWKPSQDNEQ